MPGLRHHPEWMNGAETYFHKYGIASLLVGRFIGPLRPMRPLVLGSIPAGDDAPRSADSGLQSIGLTETLALGLEKDPRYRAAKADFLANAEATPQARAAYLPTATYDFQRNSENQRIISSTIAATAGFLP